MINSVEYIGGLSATKCCSNMLNKCGDPYLARTHESRTHLSREPTTLRTIASTLDSYKEPTTVTSTVVEAHGRTAASRTREGGDVAVPGSSAARSVLLVGRVRLVAGEVDDGEVDAPVLVRGST